MQSGVFHRVGAGSSQGGAGVKDDGAAGTVDRGSPRGLMRWLLRLPILFYRLNLGWLFGRRFLLLMHTGRSSGKPRATVLEVLRYEADTHRCIIASGWGTRSQWYRNVMHDPRVRYTLGVHERAGHARQLSVDGAEQQLRDYGDRHATAIRKLTKLMIGESYDGSSAQYRRLASRVPVLELIPVDSEDNRSV